MRSSINKYILHQQADLNETFSLSYALNRLYTSSYSVTRGPGKKLVKSGRKLDGREKQGQGSRCCEKKWKNSLKYKKMGKNGGKLAKTALKLGENS